MTNKEKGSRQRKQQVQKAEKLEKVLACSRNKKVIIAAGE